MSDMQMTRRHFAGIAAVGTATLGASLVGCSNSTPAASQAAASSAAEATASSAEEAAASSNPAEETEKAMARPVILVTSFGTSFPESRHITIGAIESAIRESFPDYDVRRAFTAQIIIDHIEEDTGRHIDNFEEAMDRAIADGVPKIIVQPTHLTDGAEFGDVSDSVDNYRSQGVDVVLGTPLLTTEKDHVDVCDALIQEFSPYEADDTAIILVGHGNEATPHSAYDKFQETLNAAGKKSYFVCTVEQTPGFEEAVTFVKEGGYTKAVLRPLMVVAGDHANNDMAGTGESENGEVDPESLAGMLMAEGIEVTNVLEGLGQINEIDDIYVEHVKASIG